MNKAYFSYIASEVPLASIMAAYQASPALYPQVAPEKRLFSVLSVVKKGLNIEGTSIMDFNITRSAGFKRPHPGAEEEPPSAVRTRQEPALGQGCSTSGGGEPDAPLPALANLPEWVDSLPSFPSAAREALPAWPTRTHANPSVATEARPAGSTGAEEGNTTGGVEAAHQARQSSLQNPLHRNLLAARELDVNQGTLAPTGNHRGRSRMSHNGVALLRRQELGQRLPRALTQADLQGLAQALRANMGREPQHLHTALRDLPNPVGTPALAFLVDSNGLLRADRLAQLPRDQRQRLEHINLLSARERLVAGASFVAVASEFGANTLVNTFDHRGRLLINNQGQELLQSQDAQVAQRASQLRRALTQEDLAGLRWALRAAGREPEPLREALQSLLNPVGEPALEFLIDANGLRADNLALLPGYQRQELQEASRDLISIGRRGGRRLFVPVLREF